MQLLEQMRSGDRSVETRLLELLYKDLRRLAQRAMAQENAPQTLTPTALVHEVYLRIFRGAQVHVKDRRHLIALSCQVMRRLLVDRARSRRRRKEVLNTLSPNPALGFAGESSAAQIIVVDQLLEQLKTFAPRAAKVVELRYFGGLEEPEIADLLESSVRTIQRDWNMAKAWMIDALSRNN